MRSNRAARVAIAGVMVLGIALGAGVGGRAAGAEPVSAAIHVSWTRPELPGTTLVPPATLRVGDTVTIRLALTGFTQAACDHLFHHPGTDAQMGATQIGEASVDGAAYCRPWTFTVPPAPPGSVNVHVTVSGDDSAGGDAYASPTDIPLSLESGGSHQPFLSTYPTPSWAPIDFLGTATPTMGTSMVFARPPGATRECDYGLQGDWTTSMHVAALDRSCSDWVVTLPDLRPAAVSEHPEDYPWQAQMRIGGATDDADTGASLAGYALTGPISLTGNGGDNLATNLPAVVFPDRTNPRYVLTGSTVTVRPEIHGVTDPDAVCRTWFGGPEDGVEMWAPVDNGGCESVTFVASEPGDYPVLVQVHSGEAAGSWSQMVVWAVDSMTTPSLEFEAPVAGTPFDVASSVGGGVPAKFEFTLADSGVVSDDPGVATADVMVAEAGPCSAGSVNFLDEARSVAGTCTAPLAGTYTLSVRFTDVTGAQATRSRSITVSEVAAHVRDIIGHQFEGDIRWLYTTGITKGCAPDRFCPDAVVSRAQMASFLVRALSLPRTTHDYFIDDETSAHEADINRLRAAGITSGCTATKYCPDAPVSRAQMASFLARALALPTTSTDYFSDDAGNPHEGAINRLRAGGITGGCAPNRFCPDGSVTRGQMAAFLHRAFTR